MDDKEIKRFISDARRANDMDMMSIEKHSFQSLLLGMIIKLKGKTGVNVDEQLAALERMSSFMDRMTYKNCIFHFQSLTITAQDTQIAILQQDKMDLIIENETLKKNIN